ncbi:MAG: GntR family transcriptional regulator [Polyangiaceae bacterium]
MEEQNQSSNIADSIFRELRRQILVGELAAGERLPGERDLATTYGTNRNTLREAVRKLEQARLVTVRHGQGVTISDYKKTGTMELLSPMLEAGGSLLEVVHILEDILPAREQVLEFATRLAVRRADSSDIDRLTGITELLITAFETKDGALVGKGFHRWLEALIDAGHSTAIRWISNPFLEAYRDILGRYPALWVLESSFPNYLRETLSALADGDEERAIAASREYYQRVDREFVVLLKTIIKPTLTGTPPPPPPDEEP